MMLPTPGRPSIERLVRASLLDGPDECEADPDVRVRDGNGDLPTPAALAAQLGLPLAALPTVQLESALLGPARAFLARPGKRFRAELATVGWQMAGGGRPPAALGALVEILHAGSLIIDDIEDGSAERRGAPCLHRQVGVPLALNAGNFLYFWPFALISQLALPERGELRLRRMLEQTLLCAHAGQALDLGASLPALSRDEVRRIVPAATELKTGRLTEFAAAAGAVALEAPAPRARALAEFGRALGVALQMLDDLGNLRGRAPDRHGEDLRLGRPTWPWAWAAERLSASDYADLRGEAAAVLAGQRPPVPLAERLGAAVGEYGRREAHRVLRASLDQLSARVGDGEALDALRREAERLEQSHG
jgi:geranylgeranyl pyrophosphate synthase